MVESVGRVPCDFTGDSGTLCRSTGGKGGHREILGPSQPQSSCLSQQMLPNGHGFLALSRKAGFWSSVNVVNFLPFSRMSDAGFLSSMEPILAQL